MSNPQISWRDAEGHFPAGVYRYSGYDSASEVLEEARSWGWSAWLADVESATSKVEFISDIAAAMEMPTWQGKNWDALEETLRDLPWTRNGENPATGYLLILTTPRDYIRNHPHEWNTALSIFREVGDFWQGQGVPFVLLLRRTYGMLDELPEVR